MLPSSLNSLPSAYTLVTRRYVVPYLEDYATVPERHVFIVSSIADVYVGEERNQRVVARLDKDMEVPGRHVFSYVLPVICCRGYFTPNDTIKFLLTVALPRPLLGAP